MDERGLLDEVEVDAKMIRVLLKSVDDNTGRRARVLGSADSDHAHISPEFHDSPKSTAASRLTSQN